MKIVLSILFKSMGMILLAGTLIVSPAAAAGAGEIAQASIPAEVGYIDFSYGTAVKPEPTGEISESKTWFNDGFWWSVMFDPATAKFTIYWFDWGEKTWVKTATTLDSRIDGSGKVATRFDALWDSTLKKLYLASHIKLSNPSRVNGMENWGRLYQYSYQPDTNTYQLESGYPVALNQDKVESLVIDKDSSGRLWATYVSRVPVPVPNPQVYKLYVSYTTSASDHRTWSTIDMTTINATAATVLLQDTASVITYKDKVGIMWSNQVNGQFYFAEHPAGSSPAEDWTITPISVPNVKLTADDHIKLIKNSVGQVFAAIKTGNTLATEPLIGVLARDTNGSFSFHVYSNVSSIDTKPTVILNESDKKLYMFVTSNESGGIICFKSMQLTTPLANMQFPAGNCSRNLVNGNTHFIVSDLHPNVNDVTTTKQNINSNTGLVVLAVDDDNGKVYMDNTLGNPLPVVTRFTPARGSTVTISKLIVSVTFSHAMAPSSLNSSHFIVTGPNGPVAGTISYNAVSRTATFIGNSKPVDQATYKVTLTTGITDKDGRALFGTGETWQFKANVAESAFYLPLVYK